MNSLKTKRIITLFCILLLSLSTLAGCGKKAIDCPFTDLGWDTTPKQLFEAEGECAEPYASTYGGQTYPYSASYMGYEGTIKYMYDGNDELMNVAFAYGSTDADELKEFYDKLVADVEGTYGKSTHDTEEDTNYGKVWELKEGHIILSVMLTDSNKALQIAYVNPENDKE